MKSKACVTISPELENILCSFCGLDRHFKSDSRITKQLARLIKEIADTYQPASGRPGDTLFPGGRFLPPYVLYYLPANLVKLFPVIDELVHGTLSDFLKKNPLSFLDLGCGPGTFSLGLLEYLVKKVPCVAGSRHRVSFWAVDRVKENIQAAETLITTYLSSGVVKNAVFGQTRFLQHSVTASYFYEKVFPEHLCFDLIVAGNIVNELDQKYFPHIADFLEKHLSPRGAVVLIDPGTQHSSKKLLRLRDIIIKKTSLNLYAPCLQAAPCPLQETAGGWCHEKLFWAPPEWITRIDEYTGFTKRKGLKFSYFTFVKENAHLAPALHHAPTKALWRVVSYLIKNKGEERLHLCNGKDRILLRRLCKNASEGTVDFAGAGRGDLVRFDGAISKHGFFDLTKESLFTICRAFQPHNDPGS